MGSARDEKSAVRALMRLCTASTRTLSCSIVDSSPFRRPDQYAWPFASPFLAVSSAGLAASAAASDGAAGLADSGGVDGKGGADRSRFVYTLAVLLTSLRRSSS